MIDLLDRLRIDVPVVQAGMGGGIAGPRLASAVANAGGLGTLGLAGPAAMRTAIGEMRAAAPDRAVAVNLLLPFVRRAHVRLPMDVAVLFFGGGPAIVRELHDAGVFVLVQIGSVTEARDAIGWGADGLIAQGIEAGGHLRGTLPALAFVPQVLAVAGDRPVLLAGGIATAADTRAALTAGAAAVVAGTRFLLTSESGAHRAYRQRLLDAESTIETTLFGMGWPDRHRVVPNAATRKWCDASGKPHRLPALINAASRPLGRIVPVERGNDIVAVQRPGLPIFSPATPIEGMPDSVVDRTALYAGDSALRITEVVSAAEAVRALTA